MALLPLFLTAFRGGLVGLAGALILLGSCHRMQPEEVATLNDTNSPKESSTRLLWISLDALQRSNLSRYIDKFVTAHPRGLKWILSSQAAVHNESLQISYPTITASSHISTITCQPAGRTGVFLNGGNWNGERDQSGFGMSFPQKTWIQKLRSEGYRIGVAAYPSFDGQTPERRVDEGVSYDTPVGKAQYVKIAAATPTVLEIPSRLDPAKKFKVELSLGADGLPKVSGSFVPKEALTIAHAVDGFEWDVPATDSTDSFTVEKRRAQVTFMSIGLQPDGLFHVVVSPLSIMPVQGEELKGQLAAKDIVWSNIKDFGFSRYSNGVDLTLESLKHRRDKIIASFEQMLANGHEDGYVLYFEDIDSILHAYIGLDQYDAVLTKFLEEFDQDLGRLIARLPKDVNLVVMGDHGMSAIQYEINARKLLPEGVSKYFQMRTSGGSLLLFPNGALNMEVPQGLDLNVVAEHLRNQVVEFDGNRKVFKSVVVRDDASARAMGLDGSMSPWISAFAEEGIAVQDRLENPYLVSRRESFVIPQSLSAKYPDPVNSGSLVQPTPLGAHGHDSTLDSMKTHFFASGKDMRDLTSNTLVPKYNLEVVPFVAKRLGWPTFDDCGEIRK